MMQHIDIPHSRNTVKVEFTNTTPQAASQLSSSSGENSPIKHVFFSSVEIPHEPLPNTHPIESGPHVVNDDPLLNHMSSLNINPQRINNSLASPTNLIQSPTPRPSFHKQANDVRLLIQQYYLHIKNRIFEVGRRTEVDIELDYSNYEGFSEEEKTHKPVKVSIPTVLYLIDQQWFSEWESAVLSANSSDSSLFDIKIIDNHALTFDRVKRESSKLIQESHVNEDAVEGVDYVLVPKEVWDALKSWYGGGSPVIPRKGMITVNSNQYVYDQVNEIPDESLINTLKVSSKAISSIFPGYVLIMEIFPVKPFTEADSLIFHDMMFSSRRSSESPKKSLSSHSPTNKSTSPFSPQKPSDINSKSSELYIFTDVGSSLSKGTQCYVCHSPSKFRCSKCTAVYYCSQNCQKIHWKYHKSWCALAGSNKCLSPPEFYQAIPLLRKRGKVGLMNLGNSCYMNSSLQCLLHITPIVSHILSERYSPELNLENRDGTGGALINELHELLKQMWLDSKSLVSPVGIKRILGKINSDFAGSQQHDAHEVTMLLLDKLHEDLNRVKKKPYTTSPEGDGSNDEAVFQDAWANHLLRENSAINDLIGGAVRNEINCHVCRKTVVKFDSQHTVQLAIPKNNSRVIHIVYVPSFEWKLGSIDSYDKSIPKLLSVSVDKHSSVKNIKSQLVNSYKDIFSSALFNIDDIMIFSSERQTHLLSRYLFDGNESIKTALPVDDYLTAYVIPKKKQDDVGKKLFYAVLIQRKFSFRDNWQGKGVKSVGIPKFVTVSSDWSCLRIRILILQQIEHLFGAQSYIRRIYNELIAEMGEIKAQMKLASNLPIRLVDDSGQGLRIPLFDQIEHSSSANSKDQLIEGLEADVREFGRTISGSLLPADKAIIFLEEVRKANIEDIVFLSVDWSHKWFESYDEDLANRVIIPPSSLRYLEQSLQNYSCIKPLQTDAPTSPKAKSSMFANLSELAFQSPKTSDLGISLEQCFREHSKVEVLDNGNEWYCGTCKKHQKATKQVTFWRGKLPEILILSLKRFEFRGGNDSALGRYSSMFGGGSGHREKIEDFVDFPLEGLDILPFCHNLDWSSSGIAKAHVGSHSKLEMGHSNVSQSESTLYDLFAVCNHYGRMGFGHYTAFARDFYNNQLSSQWYSFDDDAVRACSNPEEVKTRAAYILFYRRRH